MEVREKGHKGFKGFNSDFTCKGKQFFENEIVEETNASPCKCGIHYCENPFDVLNYYEIVNDEGQLNQFSEVEALDESLTDDGKKFCTKKIKIGAKIGLKGFVKACVDFAIEKTTFDFSNPNISSGNCVQIGSSGNDARIGSSGNYAQIGSSGNDARIGSSGNDARIGSSGDYAKIGSSGNRVQIGSSGNDAQIGSSGNCARIE